jgi:hypothetical protein
MRWTISMIILSAFLAGPTQAWVRSRAADSVVCLRWNSRQVTIYLNSRGSDDLSLDDCKNAFQKSLSTWNQVTCSDFRFDNGGETENRDVGYDRNNGKSNQNIVLWQEDEWNHSDAAIAITTSTYDKNTGEVVDSDIEFNGINYSYSTLDPPYVETDVSNTLVHELGHVLGLDHSPVVLSTMYESSPPGDLSKRSLHHDDIDGMCSIYPDGEETQGCEEENPDSSSGGCGCASQDRSVQGLVFLLFGLVLALSLRRLRYTTGQGESLQN